MTLPGSLLPLPRAVPDPVPDHRPHSPYHLSNSCTYRRISGLLASALGHDLLTALDPLHHADTLKGPDWPPFRDPDEISLRGTTRTPSFPTLPLPVSVSRSDPSYIFGVSSLRSPLPPHRKAPTKEPTISPSINPSKVPTTVRSPLNAVPGLVVDRFTGFPPFSPHGTPPPPLLPTSPFDLEPHVRPHHGK